MIDSNLQAIWQMVPNPLVDELYVHVDNIRRLGDPIDRGSMTDRYVIKRIPRSKVTQAQSPTLAQRRAVRGHSSLAFTLWVFRWSTIPLPHFLAFAICVAAVLLLLTKNVFSSEHAGQNRWLVVALIASFVFFVTGVTSVWVQRRLKRW